MRLRLLVVLACCLCGCYRMPRPEVGGLYSVRDGKGPYRIAKVVALDEDGIHLRLYRDRWGRRPKAADPASLSLGAMNDPDGFGIGHLVLEKQEFASWRPVFIRREDPTPDELEGYKVWKQGRKGDFVGKP